MARDADALSARKRDDAGETWERISFADERRHVLGLIPQRECLVLDIGAGTGRGSAWFADRGNRVVAVEPVDELRAAARRLRPSSRIEWLDDALPHLSATVERGERFDVAILTAVWMNRAPLWGLGSGDVMIECADLGHRRECVWPEPEAMREHAVGDIS